MQILTFQEYLNEAVQSNKKNVISFGKTRNNIEFQIRRDGRRITLTMGYNNGIVSTSSLRKLYDAIDSEKNTKCDPKLSVSFSGDNTVIDYDGSEYALTNDESEQLYFWLEELL